MAIYHLRVKIHSRGNTRRTAVEAAAYRSGGKLMLGVAAYRAGEKLQDVEGKLYDYTAKEHVEHTEILAPENAPDWVHDRAALWNAVEASEKRKDSRLAREVELSLPRELSEQERIELVRGYVRSQFVDAGMVADVAIHNPDAKDGEEQPHAHILLTLRRIDENGFAAKRETAWNSWGDNSLLKGWRASWADHANAALEAAGHDERIDHRSLADQQAEALAQGNEEQARKLDREPTKPRGVGERVPEERRTEAAKERLENREAIEERNRWRKLYDSQFQQASMQGTKIAMPPQYAYGRSKGYDAQELAAHLWGREQERDLQNWEISRGLEQ